MFLFPEGICHRGYNYILWEYLFLLEVCVCGGGGVSVHGVNVQWV